MKPSINLKIRKTLDWIIAFCAIALSFSMLIQREFLISIIFLLMGFTLLPLTQKFLKKKGISIPQGIIVLILIIGMLIIMKLK